MNTFRVPLGSSFVEVEFDYEPPEAESFDCPGYDASCQILKVKVEERWESIDYFSDKWLLDSEVYIIKALETLAEEAKAEAKIQAYEDRMARDE